MNSAICTGAVDHRRFGAVPHAFRYPIMMLYLDLAELNTVFGMTRLWSHTRPAPAWFRRVDYLGDPDRALDECVRDAVEAQLGFRPAGPIRMVTHPRYFGFIFNPITLYFCFDDAGRRVMATVADVSNTPWNERHTYVWPAEAMVDSLRGAGHDCAKAFHVSPFMPMDQRYRVRIVHRARGFGVQLESWEADRLVHTATLTLRKRAITPHALRRALVTYPAMTAQVVARIYIQAARLWWKRAPFHAHPARRRATKEMDTA